MLSILLANLLALVFMTFTAVSLAAAEPLPAERLLQTTRPLVIGHRGYNAFAPENTLPSFRLAKAAGVDVVELDYHERLGPEWISEAKNTWARVIGWNNLVTREAVAHTHRQGLKVWIYTINDPVEAAGLLDWGVDGIITDNPSVIWRAMALRGHQEKTSQ